MPVNMEKEGEREPKETNDAREHGKRGRAGIIGDE